MSGTDKTWGEDLKYIEDVYEGIKSITDKVLEDNEGDGNVPRSCRPEMIDGLHNTMLQLEKVMKCLSYTVEFRRRFG